MDAWQPTIATNPWLFSGELVPIYQLINDPTKKASMERAVTNIANKALLREYERLLIAASSRLTLSFTAIQVKIHHGDLGIPIRNLFLFPFTM